MNSGSTDPDLKLLEALGEDDIIEAKKIMENLFDANDFLTAVAVLHPRNKDSNTIVLYNSLFLSFKKKEGGFINHSLPKGERRIWNEILIEMSLVLWKWRDKFEPKMWQEVSARIYEEGLKKLGDDKDDSEGDFCDICMRVFSQLLFNFMSYARVTDNPRDFHISEEKIKKLSKEIGSSWEAVTYSNLIEKKVKELSR